MNILHLTHTDIKSDSRILKEMQSLKKLNNEFKIYGIGIERSDNRNSSTIENIEIESLIIRSRYWRKIPKILMHVLALIEFYSKILLYGLKVKPKIIHCHDIIVLPIGIIVKIITGGKLIYDAHELESKKNGISKLEGKVIFFIETIFWRLVDGLIIVSPSIQKWYKDNLGVKESKIIMNSPLIVYEDQNLHDSQYLREKFNISSEKKIFIYVGLLSQGRGIDILLNVFKASNISSHIIFLGYGELSNMILEYSKDYENIHLHDAVPHEKVIPIVKSADVGLCFIQNVSLSDYYCLPNKLFEYAFSSIPVLASNFPDIVEVVNKYNLGSCSEMSEESILKTVLKYDRLKQIEKIHQENLYDLSWQAQEEKLVSFYNKILNKN